MHSANFPGAGPPDRGSDTSPPNPHATSPGQTGWVLVKEFKVT